MSSADLPVAPDASTRALRAATPLSRLARDGAELQLQWGDFHNHCSVGLLHHAKGTLERSIENARSHLDFFAFTGHAQFHDMPPLAEESRRKWMEGFEHHTREWPKTKALIKAANQPGEFVAFLGYEWHSAHHGDRCIIFKDDNGDLRTMQTFAEVEALAREFGALLYPHHVGYKQDGRGLNWAEFNPEFSPIVEIQSEHGCAERDRGPYPYISHSMGPRTTGSTYQSGLARGFHCGVAGGSDDHIGFPGAYREGVIGVFARGLTRSDILDGVWRRRTLASTGDRIGIQFEVNDGFIGDILPAARKRHIRAAVSGWDEIDQVELIKNNAVVHRHHPPAGGPGKSAGQRHLLRFEYGWGPWANYGETRTTDWEIDFAFAGARVVGWEPCFQSAPFDAERRHRFSLQGDTAASLVSYTSRAKAHLEVPTNAVVFELDGGLDGTVTIDLKQPRRQSYRYRLADLLASSQVELMGGFPSESFLVHRLVSEGDYRTSFEYQDEASGRPEDYYYLRVTQSNNQLGWCSPIWAPRPGQS